MPTRLSFRVLVAAALVAVLALASWPRIARAQGDVRDEVVRALAAQPFRADLVVVLDTSGSMAKHFDEARKFVGDLAELARPDDTITFIAFAGRGAELMPPVTVRAGGADALRARLAKLHPPSAQHTDLGAGLEATLDALLRPSYAPLSMVFLITDFCAEPPPASPYAGKLEGAGPCRSVRITESLKKKSARLFGTGDQAVRTFALALEPTSEAGLAAARETLGSLVRVDVNDGDLAKALGSVRARIDHERATLAIEQTLRRPPIVVEPPREPLPLQGARDIELGITANPPLTMTVGVREIRAVDGSVRFDLANGGRPLEFSPKPAGAAAPAIPLAVRAQHIVEAARDARTGPHAGSPFESTRRVDLELLVDVELAPSGAIEKLLGAPPRASAVVRQKVELRFVPPDVAVAPISLEVEPDAARLELAPRRERPVALVLRSLAPWADLDVTCTLDGQTRDRVRLAPGATATLPFVVKNDTAPRPLRFDTADARALTIAGTCVVVAIAADGAEVRRGQYPVAATVTLTWREGMPRVPVIAFALVIALALAAYAREVRLRVAPAALAGRLVLHDGPGDFRRVTIDLRGRARLALQGAAANDAHVRLDGDRVVLPGPEGATAELYAQKVGNRSVMRLRNIEGDALEVDARAVGATSLVVRRRRARFVFGGYRFRIE